LAEFDIDAIVTALNAAALDPEQWDRALELVAGKSKSFGAIVFPQRGMLPYLPATKSMGDCFDVFVRDGWVNRDEREIRGKNKLIAKGVVTDGDIMSEQEIRKSPYYQDFLARINLKGWVGIRVGSGDQIWALTLHRKKQDGEFSRAELRSFHELSKRLAGTAQIASSLAFARGEAALLTFETAGKAAMLLNRGGEVVRINAAAERLFDADVNVVKKRLFCSDRKAIEQFEGSMKRLLWSRDRAGVPPTALPRPGRSPVIAYLMRSFQLAETPLSTYHAIAVLVDPDARLVPAIDTLRTVLDLTPAEARLAIALQSGDDVSEAATRLSISPETARKQLKAIFAKTGVRRQSGLIALLANLLPNA
jgi:DNA-binding CsgD family transcriptional regulator